MENVPKKFLGVSNLIFILPDDFEGDISDAAKLITEYINDVSLKTKPVVASGTEEGTIFDKLLKKVNRNRLTASFVFYEFDEKTQTYQESSFISNE